jgi:DNA-binding MarR family transcriptional regulator
MSEATTDDDATALAVALYDLAWLLPRTVGVAADAVDPLPQSELEVMRLLVRRPGLSVNDVARELGMQASNASAAIRALVTRGLLERRRDADDRRVARIHPTARAIAARNLRERSWGAALGGALDGLERSDTTRLLETVGALRALVSQLSSADPGVWAERA